MLNVYVATFGEVGHVSRDGHAYGDFCEPYAFDSEGGAEKAIRRHMGDRVSRFTSVDRSQFTKECGDLIVQQWTDSVTVYWLERLPVINA